MRALYLLALALLQALASPWCLLVGLSMAVRGVRS
jgi:hypothetical protein